MASRSTASCGMASHAAAGVHFQCDLECRCQEYGSGEVGTAQEGLSLIDAEMLLEPARDPTSKPFGMEDVGGLGDEDDVADERVETTGLLPPSFSETEISAFLWRVEEVQLAQQPGQGRREGLQNMRQVDAAFGESLRQLQFAPEPRLFSLRCC